MLSHQSSLEWDSNCFWKSSSHICVNLCEHSKHFLLNIFLGYSTKWSTQVLNELVFFLIVKDFLPQASWLFIVALNVVDKLVSSDMAWNGKFGLGTLWILLWSVEAVVWLSFVVAIHAGGTVSDVGVDWSLVWAVNWDVFVIGSESISLGIWVREKSSLEEFIHGWFNSWH